MIIGILVGIALGVFIFICAVCIINKLVSRKFTSEYTHRTFITFKVKIKSDTREVSDTNIKNRLFKYFTTENFAKRAGKQCNIKPKFLKFIMDNLIDSVEKEVVCTLDLTAPVHADVLFNQYLLLPYMYETLQSLIGIYPDCKDNIDITYVAMTHIDLNAYMNSFVTEVDLTSPKYVVRYQPVRSEKTERFFEQCFASGCDMTNIAICKQIFKTDKSIAFPSRITWF